MALTIRTAKLVKVGEIAAVRLRAASAGYAGISPADAKKQTRNGLGVLLRHANLDVVEVLYEHQVDSL